MRIPNANAAPIHLKTFRGALVLRDSKPEVPLAIDGDGTAYELVGYQNLDLKNTPYNFLFSRKTELKYAPPKK